MKDEQIVKVYFQMTTYQVAELPYGEVKRLAGTDAEFTVPEELPLVLNEPRWAGEELSEALWAAGYEVDSSETTVSEVSVS